MSLFFRPGRQLRRAQSGKPCPGCGLTVHANDLVLYPAPAKAYYLHAACAQLLAEQVAAAQVAEEDATQTAAAAEREARGEPLDATETIVPDCEETP
jgi:hypothetical protein